jgi:hypothetical protein
MNQENMTPDQEQEELVNGDRNRTNVIIIRQWL